MNRRAWLSRSCGLESHVQQREGKKQRSASALDAEGGLKVLQIQSTSVAYLAVYIGLPVLTIWVAYIDSSAVASFVGFAILTMGAAAWLGGIFRSPYSLASLAIVSYCYLACVSLFCMSCYQHNYGALFGPDADDSYYFLNTLDYLSGQAYSYTLYEATLGLLVRLAHAFGSTPTLLKLLPLNYACASLTTALACHLSYEITRVKQNGLLLCSLMLALVDFTGSVVHLYRDAYLFLFVTLSLVYIARSRWLAAGIACSPVLFLRPFNFAIAMSYAFLKYTEDHSIKNTATKLLVQVGMVVTVVLTILLLDSTLQLGTYTRSIHEDREQESLSERLAAREWLMEASTDDDDITALLWHSGWGRPLLPAVVVVNPCRIPMHFCYVDDYFLIHTRGTASGFWPRNLLILINVLLLPLMLSLLVLGACRAFREKASSEILFFVITLLLLAFVSFQGRHRMALYVLYPTFWAWGLSEYRRLPDLAWFTATGAVAAILVRLFV